MALEKMVAELATGGSPVNRKLEAVQDGCVGLDRPVNKRDLSTGET
jgi:hypothetical protein